MAYHNTRIGYILWSHGGEGNINEHFWSHASTFIFDTKNLYYRIQEAYNSI